jgi:hypothetical protein
MTLKRCFMNSGGRSSLSKIVLSHSAPSCLETAKARAHESTASCLEKEKERARARASKHNLLLGERESVRTSTDSFSKNDCVLVCS